MYSHCIYVIPRSDFCDVGISRKRPCNKVAFQRIATLRQIQSRLAMTQLNVVNQRLLARTITSSTLFHYSF